MVQTLPSAMVTALQQSVTYMCRIWRLELTTGEVFTFTDHDRDVTHSSIVYKCDPGMLPSAVQCVANSLESNMTIDVRTSDAFIDLSRIRQGALQGASFELWETDWRNPNTYGRIDRFAGKVFRVLFKDKGRVTLELNDQNTKNTKIGEVYSRLCRARLGDSRCQVDLSSYAVDFIVTNVWDNGYTITANEFTAIAGSWFANGHIIWETGLNVGLRDEVRDSKTDGRVSFMYTLRNPASIGDTGKIYPGCDKTEAACKVKFDNLLHMRGEPYVVDDLFRVLEETGTAQPTQPYSPNIPNVAAPGGAGW